MLNIIVAKDLKNGIGKDGQLLYPIPSDLKYFKQLTTGKTVVMGRKTWDSLPNKPLPGRKNIVISHTFESTECTVLRSINEFLETYDEEYTDADDVFVIGGGEIYKQLLPYTYRIYLTRIFSIFEADTFFDMELVCKNFNVVDNKLHDDEIGGLYYAHEIWDRKT